MYYKRSTGAILVRKSADFPNWVQWMHHSEGKTHCKECLRKAGEEPVSFISGWMVYPNGRIQLTTPYGGK